MFPNMFPDTRVVYDINQFLNTPNKGLYRLPLSVVTGTDNIIDYLHEKGVSPVQVVRKKPEIQKVRGIFYRIISEEEIEVAHLLGTNHVANENMLRLNPTMRQALEKANSVYLEMKPGGSRPNMEITFSQGLQGSKRKKLENFVGLLFPQLINKLTEEGVSNKILKALSIHYKYASLEIRLNLAYSLLIQLSSHNAKIVHMIVHMQGFLFQLPIGIDNLLMNHAMTNGKDVSGLEENTPERLDIFKQIADFLFSEDAIENLPTTKEGIELFISKKLKDQTDMCEAWTTGNESFIKERSDEFKGNPSLYAKCLSERNTVMANKIHEVLSKKNKEDKPFFAIGSIHVVGNGENVICQLEKKGWRLERV